MSVTGIEKEAIGRVMETLVSAHLDRQGSSMDFVPEIPMVYHVDTAPLDIPTTERAERTVESGFRTFADLP